ncbi:LPS export ABC transporter periplasmic protein LptC [bacterium]|nr:MAG: LPS export ABC transporter periplasmic protein LptC [bacterium]
MTRPIAIAPVAILAAGLALAGCSGSGAAKAPEKTAKEAVDALEREELQKKEQIPVAMNEGTADRRDPEKNVKLYTVSWQTALLILGRAGIQEGKMNGVTGTVYQEEKTKSTFAAETGYAKKETQTLYLEGKVVVKSPEYGATLRAEKLEWLPDVKRYRATGNVTLTTPNGAMGPIPVMLATSDLQRVGTPDLFSPK